MNTVKDFKILGNFEIWIRFEDGYEATINMPAFGRHGISMELLGPAIFNKVTLESGGSLRWKNGLDVYPNYLREITQEKEHVA